MLTVKSAVISGPSSEIGLAIACALAEEVITGNAICSGYAQTPRVEMPIDDTAKTRRTSWEAVMRCWWHSLPNKFVWSERTGDRRSGLPALRRRRLSRAEA